MSFIVEDTPSGGDFTPVPAGLHLARCYRIVDLGTQQTEYMAEQMTLKSCASKESVFDTQMFNVYEDPLSN